MVRYYSTSYARKLGFLYNNNKSLISFFKKGLTVIRLGTEDFGPVSGNSMELATNVWLALKVVDLSGKAFYGSLEGMD
jgi:hypothetical protein